MCPINLKENNYVSRTLDLINEGCYFLPVTYIFLTTNTSPCLFTLRLHYIKGMTHRWCSTSPYVSFRQVLHACGPDESPQGNGIPGCILDFPSLQDVLEGERYSSLSLELHHNEQHFRAGRNKLVSIKITAAVKWQRFPIFK